MLQPPLTGNFSMFGPVMWTGFRGTVDGSEICLTTWDGAKTL